MSVEGIKVKNIIILLFVLLQTHILFAQSNYKNTVIATVVRIVDGDTIRVRFADETVAPIRLIGIDAPESRDNRKTRRDAKKQNRSVKNIMRDGRAATFYINSILEKGSTVLLEYDVRKRDRYNRILAYVYLLLNEEWVMLNEIMLRAGYATVMTIRPCIRYVDIFMAAERYARYYKKGLWKDK
jgi:micrococcal nuclease